MTTITSCLLNWHHQLVLSSIIISQSHISKISTRCWKDIDWDQKTLHFSHLFLFLLSKISISTLEKYEKFISLSTLETRDRNFKFLILLSKSEIRISHFSFYSRNSRSESRISLSTLEIRDQNFKFLFLLSKFEIRISNFSFYSRIYFFDSRQCLWLTPKQGPNPSKPPQIAPKIALFDPNFTFRSPKSHKNPGVGGWVNRFGRDLPKKNGFFFGGAPNETAMLSKTKRWTSAS